MITCDKCGFGHKTFEEKRACKSWDEIAAELKVVPAATQEQPAGSGGGNLSLCGVPMEIMGCFICQGEVKNWCPTHGNGAAAPGSPRKVGEDGARCCENGSFGEPHVCCKAPGNLPSNIADLRERLFNLDRLLRDPHPGLMTWCEAYGKAAANVLLFWDNSTVPMGKQK